MLAELLKITQEIEHALEAEEMDGLSALMGRRREIFTGLDLQKLSRQDGTFLHLIRECEERCLNRAGTLSAQVQAGLLAMRRQRQVARAYGNP